MNDPLSDKISSEKSFEQKKKGPQSQLRKPFLKCGNERIAFPRIAVKAIVPFTALVAEFLLPSDR